MDGVLVCTHFDPGVGWAQWTAGGRGGHTRELLNVDSDTVINNINICTILGNGIFFLLQYNFFFAP